MIRITGRKSAALAVSAVAAVAGYASYTHIEQLAAAHGATSVIAHMMPVSVDGLIVASSAALLSNASRAVARLGLALGILATLYANVESGLQSGVVGALVALWPAVAFVVASEILLGMLRAKPESALAGDAAPVPVVVEHAATDAPEPAPEHTPAPVSGAVLPSTPRSTVRGTSRSTVKAAPKRARQVNPVSFYADSIAAGTVPSQRQIKADMHVGTDRAKAIHAELSEALNAVPVAA